MYKIITTSLTFAGGGVGGLITPVLFIGANAGYFFAHILGIDTVTFASLGMVSVLAGVANTPLAASVMAIELFGATVAPYAAVSCIVSFLITGRRSIFSKQHFTFDKNMAEDEEEPAPRQSVKQLEKTLKKKNFILASVRHLIPDMKNFDVLKQNEKKPRKKKKTAEISQSDTPAKSTAEEKPQEQKTEFKKKFSLLNHLMLFPEEELAGKDGNKSENDNNK